ncbi:LysM peptidoglycan-binding domain-containing protein [Cellulosimicrobium sp. TH-20]|uniref:LysM peptidoglycan-binding domain-containing protein n=1 Tax=Cellulosimicrobium sp. TH-20 TaxID=1980001 RepID=UPI0011A74758|nr:LysM domain-containing protein [Cellulosimicrobium sp. TH-20]
MDRGTAGSRRAGGLLALLALVLVLGGATTVLSLRALHLVAALPTHRVEPWVELGAVSAGALAALWVSLSALVALACVAAEAAGRSWTTGERLLRRAAPAVVRHAARAAVGATVGAGLLVAGGTAHAAAPADDPGVVAVDLGWRPSGAVAGDEGPVPGNGASESAASTSRTPPGTSSATADGSTTGSGGPSSTRADAAPGQPAPVTSVPPSSVPPSSVPSSVSPSSVPAPSVPPSGVPGDAGTSQDPHRSQSATSATTGATPSTSAESAGTGDTAESGGTHAAGAGDVSQGAEASGAAGPTVAAEGASSDAARQRDAALAVTRDVPGPETAPEVVVVRGDSLWSIAARHLPAGSTDGQVAEAVERWYATNAHVVGADPDLVRPGQVLVAPSA